MSGHKRNYINTAQSLFMSCVVVVPLLLAVVFFFHASNKMMHNNMVEKQTFHKYIQLSYHLTDTHILNYRDDS